MTEPRTSDLIRETFHVEQIWVERNGVTTVGERPAFLDWPSVCADEMAKESWQPKGRRNASAS